MRVVWLTFLGNIGNSHTIMAFIPDKRCKVCKLINGGDEKLLRRLYNSGKFIRGGESLTKIQQDYARRYKDDDDKRFSYISLANHCKYHQTATDRQVIEARASRIEANLPKYQRAQDIVLEKGLEAIESGETKIRASDVLTATRQKQDYEIKQQDRKDSFMKMIWAYSSGELSIKERGVIEHTTGPGTSDTEG